MVCAIVALFIGHPGFGFKGDGVKRIGSADSGDAIVMDNMQQGQKSP